jgi:hypothetical protein
MSDFEMWELVPSLQQVKRDESVLRKGAAFGSIEHVPDHFG